MQERTLQSVIPPGSLFSKKSRASAATKVANKMELLDVI